MQTSFRQSHARSPAQRLPPSWRNCSGLPGNKRSGLSLFYTVQLRFALLRLLRLKRLCFVVPCSLLLHVWLSLVYANLALHLAFIVWKLIWFCFGMNNFDESYNMKRSWEFLSLWLKSWWSLVKCYSNHNNLSSFPLWWVNCDFPWGSMMKKNGSCIAVGPYPVRQPVKTSQKWPCTRYLSLLGCELLPMFWLVHSDP